MRGLGISSLRGLGIMDALKAAIEDKSSAEAREGEPGLVWQGGAAGASHSSQHGLQSQPARHAASPRTHPTTPPPKTQTLTTHKKRAVVVVGRGAAVIWHPAPTHSSTCHTPSFQLTHTNSPCRLQARA